VNNDDFYRDSLPPGFTLERYERNRKSTVGTHCTCSVLNSRYYDLNEHSKDCLVQETNKMIREWTGE
jgi:hypothetical protein